MTHHDSDITRLPNGGDAWFEPVMALPRWDAQLGHFVAERRRVWFYGLVIPLLVLAGLLAGLVTGNGRCWPWQSELGGSTGSAPGSD